MPTAPLQSPAETDGVEPESRWLSVWVLAFGVFVVGTGEFVLAGLLPLLSRSLDVSATIAGQIVTVFALTCAVAGPVLTTVTADWQRRTVLLVAASVYLLGSVWTALAPSYGHVIFGQVVAALGVGLFVPNSTITAAALVSSTHRGRAIAVVVTGFTAAAALGAPLGTALGGVLDWRATMWLAAGLAIVGFIGVLAFIPRRVAVGKPTSLNQQLRLLADPQVIAVLGTTLLAFSAVYIPYTYIGVIFEPATDGDSVRLAGLMLTLGIIGTIGNLAAGTLADRVGGPSVVGAALIWLIVSMLAMPIATSSLMAAIAIIAFYGIAAFAITTPQQHRLIALKPDAAPLLVSLNQAVLYLAIALSGLVGGFGIEWLGAQRVSVLAAGIAVAALGTSLLARRLSARLSMNP